MRAACVRRAAEQKRKTYITIRIYEGLIMGCDIHWVLEQKFYDKWVGIYATGVTPLPKGSIRQNGVSESILVNADTDYYPTLRSRYYDWFAKLAGVRGDGPSALGMPADASDLSQALARDWDSDGHSHSYLPAVEFVARYLDESDLVDHIKAKFDPTITDTTLTWLGLDKYAMRSPENFRVVFWFDN